MKLKHNQVWYNLYFNQIFLLVESEGSLSLQDSLELVLTINDNTTFNEDWILLGEL